MATPSLSTASHRPIQQRGGATVLDKPPFLARYPWVGYLLFIVCGIAYTVLAWQVISDAPFTRREAVLEKQIFDWAHTQSTPLVLLMRFLSAYGRDGVALIVLGLTIGWGRRKARRELQMLFFGVLAGELWFQLLGSLVNRPRPQFKDPFENLIGAGFPSGHATTNLLLGWLILYLLLPHIRSPLRRGLLIFAVIVTVLAISFSRLFLGLHYPSDILGGYALALAWGGLIYTLIDRAFWKRQERKSLRA